jgi:hypothetical protein
VVRELLSMFAAVEPRPTADQVWRVHEGLLASLENLKILSWSDTVFDAALRAAAGG